MLVYKPIPLPLQGIITYTAGVVFRNRARFLFATLFRRPCANGMPAICADVIAGMILIMPDLSFAGYK